MSSKNQHIPAIRFKGFTDGWEQRKLGEITESYSGGTPSVANHSYYGGSIPFIRSAEINSKNTELYLTEEGLNSSSAKLVEEGDILYALYGATSGEVGISQINGAINQAILAIKPKIEYDSNFIMQWLRRQKNSIISTYLQGGQGNLSSSIVKDLALSAPIEYEEQTKIGSFFKQLDDTIALHQLQLNRYKELKQAMLENMFTQDGEKIPKIRFNGFTEEWEQRKFKDFTKLSQGLQIAISERFLEPGENRESYITNEFLNPSSSKKYYIENPPKNVIADVDDILMTRTGNTGKVVTNIIGAFHNNFFKIDYNKEKNSKLYLYYLLTSSPLQRELLVRAGTSTIPDLNHNDFYKIKVYIPSTEEQKKSVTSLNN